MTVLSKIGSVKKRKEAVSLVYCCLASGLTGKKHAKCGSWREVDSEVFLDVTNLSSHVIIDDSLSRWRGEQEDDRPEEGIMPTGDTDDSLCETVHRTSHVSHTQTLSRVAQAELTLGGLHCLCHFSK